MATLLDPVSGRFLRAAAAIFMAALLTAASWGCSGESKEKPKAQGPPKREPVPIVASAAVSRTVPVRLTAIGTVQAYATVEVRARVGGELVGVHFHEGQEVNKGDLLFTIDTRPYEATLRHAEATVAKGKAQLENARRQVERYSSVVKKGYVAEEQYDQIVSNATALEATIRADEAAVENARLDLKYCTIRSPLNGRLGEIKVHQGNLIKPNDNDKPMVVINQVSPIYVAFSVPEKYLPDIKTHMAKSRLEVAVFLPGAENIPVRGDLAFMDNAVDRSTGTIQLKASFPNDDRALWPGQFASVQLTLTSQPDAVVIPAQAVQTGQKGPFVYIVTQTSTAEYRPVTPGRLLENEVVIEKGVQPGETVVIDGQLKLAPGSPVKTVESVQKDTGAAHR